MVRLFTVTDRHVDPPSQEIGVHEVVTITFEIVGEDASSASASVIHYRSKEPLSAEPEVDFDDGSDVTTVTIDAASLGFERGEVYELRLLVDYQDGDQREWLKALIGV
ncbi:MAG: hypothetical protein AB7V46_00410 [Thermomicrobiales bacterium]